MQRRIGVPSQLQAYDGKSQSVVPHENPMASSVLRAAVQPVQATTAPLRPPAPVALRIEGIQLEQAAIPVVQVLGATVLLALGLLLMTPALGAWCQWRKA